jgi:ribosomal protein L11 methyltransferase
MQFDSKIPTNDNESLHQIALSIVASSSAKIRPGQLEKRLCDQYALNRATAKSVIRDLVTGGELAYTYEYGSTYLEPSFAKPVRVSRHIVLMPPGHHHRFDPNDVVVRIKPGVSFGAGNHPTTRLALQGIDFALLEDQVLNKANLAGVLDIGTGSGVLLITAILCGMQTGLGIDIDACARVEAAANAKINGMDDQVTISGLAIADIHQRFSVILANLRFPSLKNLFSEIDKKAAINCFLILSGIRDDELADLIKIYEQIQFEKIWAANELGWSGVVLRRFK